MNRPRLTLPLPEKLALGAGSLASFLGYTGVASLAIPVYQMTLGIDPVSLGVALALPRLWEAFADPVMGNITDNARTRWGRRRPFIALGAVLMGLLYGTIWMVSPAWSQRTQLGYFAALSVAFFTAYTLFSVPYSSLTYEIASDHHERTRVMAHCSFFNKLGEFGYQWIFPASQWLSTWLVLGSALGGVRVVGWIVGAVFLSGTGLVPALFVRERFPDAPAHRPRVAFWSTIGQALRSRAFQVVLGLMLLNILMGMLASNVDHYVLVYYLCHGDVAAGSAWKGVLSSAYAVVGIGTIPVVVWLSERLGKRASLAAIYATTIFGGLMKWVLFDPRHPWLIVFDAVLCGPIWVAANVLLASMIADICDEDELASGQRREGMYGAVFSWVQKTAVSASFLGAGIALTLAGFDATRGGQQPPGTFTAMRGMLVASTTLPPLAALALLAFYPLDAARAAATQRALAARRPQSIAAG